MLPVPSPLRKERLFNTGSAGAAPAIEVRARCGRGARAPSSWQFCLRGAPRSRQSGVDHENTGVHRRNVAQPKHRALHRATGSTEPTGRQEHCSAAEDSGLFLFPQLELLLLPQRGWNLDLRQIDAGLTYLESGIQPELLTSADLALEGYRGRR